MLRHVILSSTWLNIRAVVSNFWTKKIILITSKKTMAGPVSPLSDIGHFRTGKKSVISIFFSANVRRADDSSNPGICFVSRPNSDLRLVLCKGNPWRWRGLCPGGPREEQLHHQPAVRCVKHYFDFVLPCFFYCSQIWNLVDKLSICDILLICFEKNIS